MTDKNVLVPMFALKEAVQYMNSCINRKEVLIPIGTLNLLESLIKDADRPSLKQFFKEGNYFSSGDYVCLASQNAPFETIKFLVGDATSYHGKSTNDGGIGWDEYLDYKIVSITKIDLSPY